MPQKLKTMKNINTETELTIQEQKLLDFLKSHYGEKGRFRDTAELAYLHENKSYDWFMMHLRGLIRKGRVVRSKKPINKQYECTILA